MKMIPAPAGEHLYGRKNKLVYLAISFTMRYIDISMYIKIVSYNSTLLHDQSVI